LPKIAFTDWDETGAAALIKLTSLAIASTSDCLKGDVTVDWAGPKPLPGVTMRRFAAHALASVA